MGTSGTVAFETIVVSGAVVSLSRLEELSPASGYKLVIEAGAFADLMGKMNEAKTQLQTTTRTVKVYAEEAKAATAQSDP